MITFATQEDFEAAVMAVVRERLKIKVFVGGTPNFKTVEVVLEDTYTGKFAKDEDNG